MIDFGYHERGANQQRKVGDGSYCRPEGPLVVHGDPI